MGSSIVNKIPEALDNLVRETSEWTRESAEIVRQEIIRQGNEPKSGKKIGKKKTSSAPGEGWANQSGELGRSFTKESRLLSMTLGSALARAKMENGLKNIDARPAVEKSIEKEIPTLENLLQAHCRKAEKI